MTGASHEWDTLWAAAYSDGHNNRGLRGRRLAHYAHAYADICDETGKMPHLAVFFVEWDAEKAYEGDANQNWHPAKPSALCSAAA